MGEAGRADLAPGRGAATPHPPFSVAPFVPVELLTLAQWPGCGEEAERGTDPGMEQCGCGGVGAPPPDTEGGLEGQGSF